jgi:hypothetical protein
MYEFSKGPAQIVEVAGAIIESASRILNEISRLIRQAVHNRKTGSEVLNKLIGQTLRRIWDIRREANIRGLQLRSKFFNAAPTCKSHVLETYRHPPQPWHLDPISNEYDIQYAAQSFGSLYDEWEVIRKTERPSEDSNDSAVRLRHSGTT